MPIKKEDLERMYAQAEGDQFRSAVFNKHPDIAHFYTGKLPILSKAISKAIGDLQRNRNIDHAQAVLIGYIELEAAKYYNTHGMSTAYLDQFKRNSRSPDSTEGSILFLIKNNEDSMLYLKNAVYNILLTSATASNAYDQGSVTKVLNTLFPQQAATLFDVPEISGEKLAQEASAVSLEKQVYTTDAIQGTIFGGSKSNTKNDPEKTPPQESPKVGS